MDFKRKPQVWVGILITIASFAGLFFFINPGEIWSALKKANFALVAAGIPLVAAHFALRAVRWRHMLGNDLGYMRVFHNQNIGNMLNQILPLRLGDIGRAVLIGHTKEHEVPEVLSIVAVERVLDVLTILLLLPFTLSQVQNLPGWMTKAIWLLGAAAVVAFAVAVYAADHKEQVGGWAHVILEKLPFIDPDRWQKYVKNMLSGLGCIESWRNLGIIGLYSIVLWIPMVAAYWVLLRAVHADAHPLVATFGLVAGSLSITAPSSPGQMGVYHAGVSAALAAAGVGRGVAGSFAFLFHALYMLTIIGLGVVGLMLTDATLRRTIETTVDFFSSDDDDDDREEKQQDRPSEVRSSEQQAF